MQSVLEKFTFIIISSLHFVYFLDFASLKKTPKQMNQKKSTHKFSFQEGEKMNPNFVKLWCVLFIMVFKF